ncbi:PHD finger-like domain-containing protein 5B [Glycine soja]|uniref:PHD finger-like domain-containing protein 5B n=1 Tax=Glycine soja TaxID=3848 RepID=A0A445FPW2_GLYSO|nr:PHD finger-like domain-containing protein 5B [Glycine soja]
MCFDMDKNLLMCWAWIWTWAWAFFGSGLFSEVPFPSPLHSSPSLASFSFASTVTQPSLFRVLAQVVENMAKHHPDLIMCRKQPGIAIGRLCEKCDGKCVICDSYVRPCTLVRVCDECNYGSFQGRCVICGGVGISDAYYCKECTQQEKDRDGCPKIVNLGSAKTDLFYERKKYGFKKR